MDPYEARAALLDGDRLINVEIENAAVGKRKGNVYRGRVTAVEPSLDAAFVDYGAAKDGFLPFDEVATRSLNDLTGHSRANNRSGLNTGDWILVQVTKEEVGKKGATLTMHVSLPGRFVVLMPFSDRTGVSRRLGGEERTRLKQIAQQLVLPEGFGCIVRTVGEDEQVAEIQGDLEHLLKAWYEIVDRFKAGSGVGEVHAESGLALRFVRDYMSADVTEVLVEDDDSFNELTRYVESRMPQRKGLVRRYSGDLPLFLRYGVERQIDALLDNRVALPSGGSIVIGQTEALVAIDVNSGRQKQRDIEDTAFKVNLEAAKEVARQCVLRDLGGIIVVDFIDMENEGHRRAVEDALKGAFAIDKARLTFTKIQEFGLLCFSRQRIRQAVDSGVTLPCPACTGSGRVRSPALLAMSALRKIRERLATQGQRAAYVEVTVPVEVGNFLNNRKREALVGLETRYDVMIDVLGDADAMPDDIRVTVLGEVPVERTSLRPAPETAAPAPARPAQAPQRPVRLPEPVGRIPATAVSLPAEPAAPASPQAAAPLSQAPQQPAPRSPGRERSFFRGLISRFLGLEELEEVPAQAPQMLPAPVVPPPPPPPPVAPVVSTAPHPVPAPRPRTPEPPRTQGHSQGRPSQSQPQPQRGQSQSQRGASQRPAEAAKPKPQPQERKQPPAPAKPAPAPVAAPAARPPAVPAPADAATPEAERIAVAPAPGAAPNAAPATSPQGEVLSKSAKRRRRRRRSQSQDAARPQGTDATEATETAAEAPALPAPPVPKVKSEAAAAKPGAAPKPPVAGPAESPDAATGDTAPAAKKRSRGRSRKPATAKAPEATASRDEPSTATPSDPVREIPAPPVPPPVAPAPAPAPKPAPKPAPGPKPATKAAPKPSPAPKPAAGPKAPAAPAADAEPAATPAPKP
ncbi:MAG TPA: Rne/Rng family ribonuclease, partial [Myxococcota bacterium]|nr:Rne/Rng family ribonuclease [Myxococcota bacterium]